MAVRIVYPEKRVVPDAQIEIWHTDAVANGDVEPHSRATIKDMALALDDAGIITVAEFNL